MDWQEQILRDHITDEKQLISKLNSIATLCNKIYDIVTNDFQPETSSPINSLDLQIEDITTKISLKKPLTNTVLKDIDVYSTKVVDNHLHKVLYFMN